MDRNEKLSEPFTWDISSDQGLFQKSQNPNLKMHRVRQDVAFNTVRQ